MGQIEKGVRHMPPLFYIAIFSANIAVLGELALTSIYNDIFIEFASAGIWTTILISSQSLAMMLASLVIPKLFDTFNQKTVLIAGAFLFTLAGLFGASVHNIFYMIALRILFGIGIAMVQVSELNLISVIFTDSEQQAHVLGYNNSTMSVIGAVLTVIGGYMAVSSWRNVYNIYAVGFLMIILFALFVPRVSVEKGPETQKNQKKGEGKKQSLGIAFWGFILTFLLFNIAYGLSPYYLSSYVAEHALGNASLTGIMGAMRNIGGAIFSLGFGWFYTKFRRKAVLPIYGMGFIASILLFFLPGTVSGFAGSFLIGAAYTMAMSFAYAYGPTVVPPERTADAIGIVTAVYSLGFFLSPYFARGIMSILGTEQVTPTYAGGAVLCIAAIAVFLCSSAVKRK